MQSNGTTTRACNPLTTSVHPAIVTFQGGATVKRGVVMFVMLLLGAVICVSAIPQTDLPETSYNEVDTPVNQAPPVVQGIRFVRPSVAPVILPRQVCEALRSVRAQAHEQKSAAPILRDLQSLQDVLCTFLI